MPGVVTRFDLETIDDGDIWFEGLYFDASYHEQFLQAAVRFAASADDDRDASATFNMVLGGVPSTSRTTSRLGALIFSRSFMIYRIM